MQRGAAERERERGRAQARTRHVKINSAYDVEARRRSAHACGKKFKSHLTLEQPQVQQLRAVRRARGSRDVRLSKRLIQRSRHDATTEQRQPHDLQARRRRGRRRGQERPDHPVLPEALRHRLRPHHRGQLHPAHRGRQAVVHLGRPRHGGPGGVQCHERAVHAQGRRLPLGLLRHRQAVLREHRQFLHPNPARQGQGRLPDAPRRQQGRPGPSEEGHRGAGQRAGAPSGHPLHRDLRQGSTSERRCGFSRGCAHHQEPATR